MEEFHELLAGIVGLEETAADCKCVSDLDETFFDAPLTIWEDCGRNVATGCYVEPAEPDCDMDASPRDAAIVRVMSEEALVGASFESLSAEDLRSIEDKEGRWDTIRRRSLTSIERQRLLRSLEELPSVEELPSPSRHNTPRTNSEILTPSHRSVTFDPTNSSTAGAWSTTDKDMTGEDKRSSAEGSLPGHGWRTRQRVIEQSYKHPRPLIHFSRRGAMMNTPPRGFVSFTPAYGTPHRITERNGGTKHRGEKHAGEKHFGDKTTDLGDAMDPSPSPSTSSASQLKVRRDSRGRRFVETRRASSEPRGQREVSRQGGRRGSVRFAPGAGEVHTWTEEPGDGRGYRRPRAYIRKAIRDFEGARVKGATRLLLRNMSEDDARHIIRHADESTKKFGTTIRNDVRQRKVTQAGLYRNARTMLSFEKNRPRSR